MNHRVTKYEEAKTGYWFLNFWQGGKRVRKSTGTKNRKLAEIEREKKERELIVGIVDPPRSYCISPYK